MIHPSSDDRARDRIIATYITKLDELQNDPEYQYLRDLYECQWSLLTTYRRQRQCLKADKAGLFLDKNGNHSYRKLSVWCKQHGFTYDQLRWNQERWYEHLYKLDKRQYVRRREQRKAGQG